MKLSVIAGLLVMSAIIVAHVYPMITRHNSWPVSSYPMFSHKESDKQAKQFGLIAEANDGQTLRLPVGTNKWTWFTYKEAIKSEELAKIKKQVMFDFSKVAERADTKTIDALKNMEVVRLKLVRFQTDVEGDDNSKQLVSSYKVLHSFNL